MKTVAASLGRRRWILGVVSLGRMFSYAPALPKTHLHLRRSQINSHIFS